MQVLMLSVDASYGEDKAAVIKKEAKILGKNGVAWPNIILPNGFDDCQRQFNLDGYGVSVIGPDGIVRGIDVYGDDLAAVVAKAVK